LLKAGFRTVFANDSFPYARETYVANLPDTDYHIDDITNIRKFPSADVLVGCYPCTGFSQGGVRDARRGVNYLYREFDRVLRTVKPKAFIVENVSGMNRSTFQGLLRNQIIRFRMAGYRVNYAILNAADFGVPQERQRMFIVGIRSDYGIQYQFPHPTHGPHGQSPYVTISDAMWDLPRWPVGDFHDDKFHWYYLSRNRWRGWHDLSKTIVSHPRHMPLHPDSPPLVRIHTDSWTWAWDGPRRRLSCHEAARLQGFPSDFVLPETARLRAKYHVVGNAVPPPLFSAVVRNIPDIW
jgi:DNA (cytosine-5)-methyltransferase 1